MSHICRPEVGEDIAEVTERYIALALKAKREKKETEDNLNEVKWKLEDAETRVRDLTQNQRVLIDSHTQQLSEQLQVAHLILSSFNH